MTNIRKKWSKSEDEELIDSYVNEELDLPDIAELHGRTQLGIASRLVKLNAAQDIPNVRGYNGRIPEKLRELKASGPILRKTQLQNDGTHSPILCKTQIQIRNNDENAECLHCVELANENEYLKRQLEDAMNTIEELTKLL
jgi:hypothetical protein